MESRCVCIVKTVAVIHAGAAKEYNVITFKNEVAVLEADFVVSTVFFMHIDDVNCYLPVEHILGNE